MQVSLNEKDSGQQWKPVDLVVDVAMTPSNLKSLEAESIYIFREVAASFERPVLLYSIGKDSSVLLHLAIKAFYPSSLPFPLLHIDTTWNFREMIAFRDQMVERLDVQLLVHTNEEGVRRGLNPLDQGSLYTDVMKTEALQQALGERRFDAAIGGDRRDEEKSGAGERVFSYRSDSHPGDPENRRPAFWPLCGTPVEQGESVRVSPLSNWTELDIWDYIRAEQIPVVPLYFAAMRPTVERDGALIVVDDERLRLLPGETPVERMVRFRRLGCYPLTAAMESSATDLDGVIAEVTDCRLSERAGETVRNPGEPPAWYRGKALMDFLGTIEVAPDVAEAFRFPVQSANRADPEIQGFSGTVRGGSVAVGDSIIAMPSRKAAAISRIVTGSGDLSTASFGDAVTLVLDHEIDVSRGDIIIKADDDTLSVADQLQAHLIWVGEEGLLAGRQYLVRMATATVPGKIITVKYRVDVETQAKIAARTLGLNDVGVVTLALDRPLPFDAYDRNRETGSFVLIDLYSNVAVAAGMILYPLRRSTNVVWHRSVIDKAARARSKGQNPGCIWFTGLSGSGKSTIANLIEKRLSAEGRHTFILDADNVRHGLNSDLGFTEADRIENVRRMAEVAKLMVDAGLIVMVCAISPYRKDREMARRMFEAGEFFEVFVDTPVEECEARDPKGLYKKARAGEIPNFTGISAPYERPADPEVHLDGTDPAEDLVDRVLASGKF